MKKFFIILFVLIGTHSLQSQTTLPIYYDFDDADNLTQGWNLVVQSPDSWNTAFAAIQNTYSASQPNAWAFASFFPDETGYNQYLISPRFNNATADSINVIFKYLTDNTSQIESFRIGYYTGNPYSSPTDFIWKDSLSTSVSTWTDYSINLPPNAQNICINYYSENQSALYIDDIVIRPESNDNQYFITVMNNDGGTVIPGTASVNAGDSIQFTVTPNEGYHIASVTLDGVQICATTSLPFTYTLHNITDNHIISANFQINEFSVSIHSTDGGSITPNGGILGFLIVPWDTTVTFTFTANEGYHIRDVILDDTIHLGAIFTYTIEHIRNFHNIYANFSPNTYTITASATTGGRITPDGMNDVDFGEELSFIITANDGYILDSLLVDGIPYPAVNPDTTLYTFLQIADNHTIVAYFSLKKYIVHFTHTTGGHWQMEGGTLIGQDSVQVTHGSSLICHALSDEGFHVTDIILNANHLGAIDSYNLMNISENMDIHAIFDTLTYSFQAFAFGNGTITPLMIGATNYFDSVTISLSANYCKQIDSVFLDGNRIGANDSYQFSHLAGAHTLTAYFGTIHYTIETDTDGNGQIEGENTVNCGNSHTYVFNSNPCYRLKDVFIDGNNSNHLIEIFNRREQITLENITENHTIYATFEHIPYMIEVISGENGTIDHVGINNVNCGDTMNFTITPDICHQIESVYLDGILINQELRFAANEDTHYGDSAFFRLSDIHQNHLIEVSFVPQEYDFTAIQGTNGTIFPDGNSLIQCGDAALYTIVPDECYVIDSVWIDRELSNSQLEFSDYDAFIIIEDIHASHDIRATFERREHQITIEVGANGNFHTDDETTLSCGDDYQFTLVPEWCYRIDSVFLNGSCINHLLDYQRNTNRNIGDSATYTLMNVSQDYDLRVTFAPILYTIIIDERDGGSITHTLDSDTALCGENVIFTIAPDTCFAISNIILNGEYFYDYEMNNGIATINFSEILTNIHLVAHFAPISYTITSNYSGNGIVFIPSNPVLCGDTTEIRFLARNCSHLDSVTIDGNLIHLDSLQQVGDTLVYTIQNISQNHFVNAFFSIDSFPVHISNNLNFPISINDTILACGNSLHFYIIQNECFKVDSIIVNEQRLDKSEFETIGTIIQNGDTTYYSINQLQEPTDIFVILDTNFYEINISCSPHGHVSYEGTHRVMCGSNLEIAVMPDSCYHWNSDYLLTLGYSIDNDSTLLLVDIHHDITLFFAFEPTIYQVTSIAGSNGSIFRDSDVDVACDGHVIFTIKPDECFEIDSVFLDNNSIINSLDTINDIISYELRHILANHEFRVTFKPKQFVVQVVGNDIGYISNIGNNDVTCGDNLDFKLVPGDCSNLDSIILDGEIYTSPLQYWGDTISFSLINIQEDHQVFIYFKRNTRHIHEQVVLDQMFFSEQSATVFCHEDTTITFSSNDCWITDSIFINHERITPSTSYHFSDIMTDIEIVIFAHTIIYEISIEQTTHGRIIQEPISDATCGDSITLLFEPERGYYIDSIIIDGDTLPASSSYSFNNISDNHSVSAIFSPYTFQITVIESDGGQITPGTSTVLYNDNLLFNITPDTCYRIDSLFVDGFYKGQADHYLFTEITDDHTISATFTLLRDTLSLTASANGQVFPSGDTILNCGDSLIYTIVPDECYQIGNLFIDGVWHNERIINDGERYTLPFNNIDTQHTISISFDPINYMFEANTNGGGTVSPMFSMPQCGNNFDFSIEPASCYQIDSVWINDSLIPLEGFTFDDYTAHYSLHNIRQDYQVYVKFKDLPHRLSFENQNNGTVSIPDTSIICNNDITFYIIPDLCYAIDNIELNNISINHLLDIHENTQSYLPDTAFYTIQNFSAETVISISYTDAPKRIITQQYYADNQLISEINALIACGSDTTLLLHEECYNIDSVWLNGIFYGNNEELILNNIIDNQTIIVNLSDIEYSITTLPTINGTIEPPGMNQVVCNHDFTCTILPDSNFFPVSLIVDNDTIPGSSTYTFFDVRTDHTLGAIFKSYTYTVTSNSGVGGSIIPETAFVDFGDNVTMQIIPDSCHIIDSVWIDDIYQGNISQIYLPNIDENHHVRATFVPYEYFITAENTMNGFITPSGVNQVLCGDDATFTITPNDGYHIENLIIDGDTISADSSYVFTNITNNHSINAVFAINSYEINTLAGNGGIITPATAFLDYGDDVTLQIIPDDCYFIDSVWVDDVYHGNDNEIILQNVTENHIVAATFAQYEYTISVTDATNGNIAPNGNILVLCGDDLTLSIAPENGYFIDSLIVDGDTISGADSYTFTDVRENHSFSAIFNIYSYEITTNAGNGGIITPATSFVNYGDDVTLHILPDDCYFIDSVWVDGVYHGNDSEIILQNVTDNHIVAATFAKYEYTISFTDATNGNITPNGDILVLCGDDLTLNIAPENGYFIDSLIVDDDTISGADSYTFTDVRDDHSFSAIFDIYSYQITTNAGNGGFITPTTALVNYGDDVTLQIIPDDCYYIDSVWIDGIYQGNDNEIILQNVTENHIVAATFAKYEYTISVTDATNGNIGPNGNILVLCGDDLTLSIAPENGYFIDSLIVDGDTISGADSYTFTDVRENHSFSAIFDIYSYQITTNAGNGGIITPTTAFLDYGDDVTLQIIPDDCYFIDSVWIDGVYQGNESEIILQNVTENHNVAATFAKYEYTISVTDATNGNITPNGNILVLCGDDLTLSIAPENGYFIDSLIIDNDTISGADSYTFTNVRENHSFSAIFNIYSYEITTNAGNGGFITPTTTLVNYGDDVTLQIIPDDCYFIDSVWIDGVYQGNDSEIILQNVTENHIVAATFAKYEYTISVTDATNGNITPNGNILVLCGDDLTLSIAPDNGYFIDSLIVDDDTISGADTYTFTDVREDHSFSAIFDIYSYQITTNTGNGGIITPTTAFLDYGDDVTLQIIPDDCYFIDSVWIDGVYQGNANEIILQNVTDNHIVAATFAKYEYTISVTDATNGNITPNGNILVLCGDDLTLNITPENGYFIDSLIVDDDTISGADSYTFTNMRENHSFSAIFDIYSYQINTLAGNGGIITPATAFLDYGDDVTLQIIPDDCYFIDSVWVDDVYHGNDNEIILQNVTENHIVAATFAQYEYTISVTDATNGNIAPNGNILVLCGDDLTLNIAPENGYFIDNLIVDGDTISGADSYTFTDVREDHSFSAIFDIYSYQITTNDGNGGIITPATALVNYGDDVTLQIVPDDCYYIDSVWIDGIYQGNDNEIILQNVTENHIVAATFAKYEYTISVTDATNGNIGPNGNILVLCGDDLTLNIAPENGYFIDSLIVDDDTISGADSYTFTDVRDDHSFSAIFDIYSYQITTNAGNGGIISPTTALVNYGDDVTLQIIPDDCYFIDSVWVDGIYQGNDNEIILQNVTDNHIVAATFAKYEYTISVTDATNGNIGPNGNILVLCGDDLTLNIAPENGYFIDSLIVDDDTISGADTYTFTDVREDHSFSAIFDIYSYQINTNAGNGGTITPATSFLDYGDDVTLQIIPDDCYFIDSVWIDGIYQGNDNEIILQNVTENHIVAATFAKYEYTISVTDATNGNIGPNGNILVLCGDDLTLNIAPENGYFIDSLIVDGDTISGADSYTFTDVRENHSFSAIFDIYSYQITTNDGNGGFITPTTALVNYGDDVTMQIIPDDCYFIDSVWVDGVYHGNDSEIILQNVTENHIVAATFAKYEYTISVTDATNGNITPNGNILVLCGDDLTLNITPENGYFIDSLVVDDDTISGADSYTFTDVRENHSFSAIFDIYTYEITTNAGNGGIISPTTAFVNYGDDVTMQIIPDDCYYIDSVWIDGVYQGNESEIILQNVTENHNVAATFAEVTYTVNTEIYINEILIENNTALMTCGRDTLITVAQDCYLIDSLIVNGINIPIETLHYIGNIHANQSIRIYLSDELFYLLATAEGNGSISPADSTFVACGSNFTYTLTPDPDAYIYDIIIDGISLGSIDSTSYTFVDIRTNHTIHVIFAPYEYIITASVEPIDGGNITPYGATIVTAGESVFYQITAHPNYEIEDVVVDEVSMGAISTYTFENVNDNHTIVAHFRATGIEENEDNEILVYSYQNTIIINNLYGKQIEEILVFDLNGKKVYESGVSYTSQQIDLMTASGTYIVQLRTLQNRTNYKVQLIRP